MIDSDTSATSVGTFLVEDAFYFTSRGLVLVGESQGQVATGYQLVLGPKIQWRIGGVQSLLLGRQEKTGLMMESPLTSYHQLARWKILGKTAQIFTP